MAQKPITAGSQIQLDPHDKFTDALSIDGVFVGYVSKPVAQYIRLASADVAAHEATRKECAEYLTRLESAIEIGNEWKFAHDETKAQLAAAQAERDAMREAMRNVLGEHGDRENFIRTCANILRDADLEDGEDWGARMLHVGELNDTAMAIENARKLFAASATAQE